jgi:CrcB protein
METLARIGFVAVGSAVGGVLRWGIGNLAGWLIDSTLPWATLFINVTGSLFLGWFLTRIPDWNSGGHWLGSDNVRLLVAVGLCGGYTTFSSFEWEGYGLIRDNLSFAGTIYLVGSVVIGLVAVRIGVALGRM